MLTRVDLSRLRFYDYYRSSAYLKPYGTGWTEAQAGGMRARGPMNESTRAFPVNGPFLPFRGRRPVATGFRSRRAHEAKRRPQPTG